MEAIVILPVTVDEDEVVIDFEYPFILRFSVEEETDEELDDTEEALLLPPPL